MFKRVKGTRDFYPTDMAARNKVANSLKKTAEKYAFGRIKTPIFETLDLLKAKSGEEVESQIFTFEKRGDEEIGLRFDMTVPAARLYIEKQKGIPKPVGWYYYGKNWRYERPQKGRLREFYQFGVELFGIAGPEADAEVISLAIESLTDLGLTQGDIVIRINNRKLLEGLIRGLKIDNIEEVVRVIDKLDKLTPEQFKGELKDLNDEQVNGVLELTKIKSFEDVEKFELNDQAKEGLKELKRVFEILSFYEKTDFVEFDLSIARGLSYYTGTVFECFDKAGTLRSIFGGGRYDDLIEKLGGQPDYATGFAIGDVTLQLLLEEKGLWPQEERHIDYYVVIVDDASRSGAIRLVQILRNKGYSVDFDLMNRKVPKQLDYAASIGSDRAIIIGENELKSGDYTVKDLLTGEERKVKEKDF